EDEKESEEEEEEKEIDKIVKKKGCKKCKYGNLFCFVLFAFDENFNKVMKWWNGREQMDKTKIIERFKTLSNEQFGVWLLNQHKWKNEITKDDIDLICFSIESHL
ncbi:hypothetical protein RFI_39954, partial [Reticulomyxa filosa]